MDPAALAPGVKLGDGNRYVIERPLARGGMGAVYIAQDAKFPGLRIALKVALAADPSISELLKLRFRREAQIGNLLGRTEGFVRAFDWGETPEGAVYLAMDLVADAQPLDLTTGPLETRLARLKEAARLVARAHERHVIHRDLKPANYLVGGDGSISLTDFGLSKILGPDAAAAPGDDSAFTRTGASAGTPPFMPPEQFEDLRSVDERADVFALGVMLHMALTGGALPYAGSMTSIIHHQQSVLEGKRPVPTPRDHAKAIPPALEALCLKATALRLEERLPSARALVEGLASASLAVPAGGGSPISTVAETRPGSQPSVRGVRPGVPLTPAPDARPPSSKPRVHPVSEGPVLVATRVTSPPVPPVPPPVPPPAPPPPRGGFRLWHGAALGCLFFGCVGFIGLGALAQSAEHGNPVHPRGYSSEPEQRCRLVTRFGMTIEAIDGKAVPGGSFGTAHDVSLAPGVHRIRINFGKIPEDRSITVVRGTWEYSLD
jgi:serine/threonine-protein kinase